MSGSILMTRSCSTTKKISGHLKVIGISVLISAQIALPMTGQAQVSASKKSSSKSEFVVTPSSLQKRLLGANTSVLASLNSVYRAKEEVNAARGNLLPSVNAQAMLSVTGAFSMANVAFLFPFLLPSNWYNVDISTSLLEADGLSHYLVQLNQYASAYTMYVTILGDMELRNTLQQQAENLEKIQQMVASLEEVGTATKADLARATAAAQTAKGRVSQVDALIQREIAALRKMLALDLNQKITLQKVTLPARSEENQSPVQLLPSVLKRSPEAEQINALAKAATAAKQSAVYSFLTGANWTVSGSEGNWSLKNSTFGGSGGIGFGYFPQVRLADLTRDELKIRAQEIRLEHARVIEGTLYSISEAQKQVTLAERAVAEMASALEMDLAQYEVGQVVLLDLLNSANGLADAMISKIRAQVDLNSQRISLQRILLVGEFAKIPKCRLKSVQQERYWLDEILGLGPNTKASVDQLCRAARKRK